MIMFRKTFFFILKIYSIVNHNLTRTAPCPCRWQSGRGCRGTRSRKPVIMVIMMMVMMMIKMMMMSLSCKPKWSKDRSRVPTNRQHFQRRQVLTSDGLESSSCSKGPSWRPDTRNNLKLSKSAIRSLTLVTRMLSSAYLRTSFSRFASAFRMADVAGSGVGV